MGGIFVERSQTFYREVFAVITKVSCNKFVYLLFYDLAL